MYMCNFVSYFVCVISCIFVFLCDILLPSGVINDELFYLLKTTFVIIESTSWSTCRKEVLC